MEIKLGKKVRDTITGFEGTVTGIAEYLSGCKRAEVVSNDDPSKEYWFDVQRLGEPLKKPGGPREAPPSRDP